MKISKEMIKKKKFVGTTGKGAPILLVETHGGLYACFAQNDKGEIETLAASPHKAITLFLAEKKGKNLKWREELDELVKSKEAELSKNLKQKMFAPSALTKSEIDCYLVYDFDEDSIIITKAEDLLELHKNKEIKPNSLIRKPDLSKEPVFAKDFDFESLQKGAKELKAMYGTNIQPHQEDFVNWATQKLPNGNWQQWAVKNHISNPKQFNDKAIKAIEHYASSKHIPNIANLRFDKHNVKEGLQAFKGAEDQYNAKALNNPQLVAPDKKTTKLMDVGDGYSWYKLSRATCNNEGSAMGHCGNKGNPKKGQNILSLRREIKIGDKIYHEPAATFILEPDGKTIGEMKGRANLIPQQKYHKYISQLFSNSNFLPHGGGYLPGNNFNLDDLSHEEHDALLAKRPELGAYSSRISPEKHIELSKNPKNHLNLAGNPNLHPEAQTKLAQSQNELVQRNLAENPNLHPELQTKLAQSQNKFVQQGLALNPNLHPEAQTKLAQSQDEFVQRGLAKNPNLLPELQTKLAQSQNKFVQQGLAKNPNLHPEAQTKLAQSQYVDVQCDLAENPNLHPEAQTKLAQSQDEYVQRYLALNPNLPPELQTKLAQSPNEYVQRYLALNPNLHPELQTKLAQSQNEYVQRYLALNPNLHPEAQTKLAQSQDEYVQRYLAENPNLHPELQTKLAQSPNEFVQRNLAGNPKVDPKIKKQAIKKLQELNPELAEEIINKLKLEKLKLESDNNLKARELRVKEYFDKLKR